MSESIEMTPDGFPVNCPVCGEAIVFPRDLPPYCEECGWPDENFDDPGEGRREGSD